MKKQLLVIMSLGLAQGLFAMDAPNDLNEQLLQETGKYAEEQSRFEVCHDQFAHALVQTKKMDYERIECLLEHGANVNIANAKGFTPLAIAAGTGDLRLVELLLKYNADINMRTPGLKFRQNIWKSTHGREGDPALWEAIRGRHVAVVKLLLEHGADVELADSQGITPLMFAVGVGSLPVAEQLLYHNANVYAQAAGMSNTSAFIDCAFFDRADIAEAILTSISLDDQQEIRKNWDKMLSIRFAKRSFPVDIQKMLIQKLINSLVQDRMNRMYHLMSMQDSSGSTAQSVALHRKHLAVASLLDLNQSQARLRSVIEARIRRILFASQQPNGGPQPESYENNEELMDTGE